MTFEEMRDEEDIHVVTLHFHCTCTDVCDCQNPPPDNEEDRTSGVYHVSNECPVHNWDPAPNPECMVHGVLDPYGTWEIFDINDWNSPPRQLDLDFIQPKPAEYNPYA